jgi:hypothetical protein
MARLKAIPPRPLVHPVCSVCGARMWFTRIEPEYFGRELLILEKLPNRPREALARLFVPRVRTRRSFRLPTQ